MVSGSVYWGLKPANDNQQDSCPILAISRKQNILVYKSNSRMTIAQLRYSNKIVSTHEEHRHMNYVNTSIC